MNKNLYKQFLINFATLGPIGRNLPAPGTFGSIIAVFIGFILLNFGIFIYLAILFLITLLSFYSIKQFTKDRKDDPSEVIADELVGQLITIFFLIFNFDNNYILLILGFLLFRFFDITKMWPVYIFEKIHGTYGIMADDIIAGLLSGIIIYYLQFYI